MSTGLECEIIGTKGKWFYILQDWDCPRMCWDWREYATCYGPFDSDEQARQHLRDHHANPGGYTICDYGNDPLLDTVLSNLIEGAKI